MNKIYKSLANSNRRIIVGLLFKNDLSVNEIVSKLSIRQATVSSHLSYLRSAGLVDFVKKGKERIYFLKKRILVDFIKLLNEEFDVYPFKRDDLQKSDLTGIKRR